MQQLGFIKDVNVNELAAKGVQISIRDIINEKVLKKSLASDATKVSSN